MLLCRRLRLPSERTCSEGGGINCCCWDGPAGKRLFLPVCGSPALAADSSTERQRQPALSHKRCYWENQWLTGIAGVFCTGEERKKGKALEQSSHIVPVLNFANHLHMLQIQSHASVPEGLLLVPETGSNFTCQQTQTRTAAMYRHRLESPEPTCVR